MTVDEWAAWEASYDTDQARVDRVRVRGYTLACITRVEFAASELERRVTLMLRARLEAERALTALRTELEHAEAMAAFVVADDPETNEQLAQALERLEEVA